VLVVVAVLVRLVFVAAAVALAAEVTLTTGLVR